MEHLEKRENILKDLTQVKELLAQMRAVETLEYYNKNWLACGKSVCSQKRDYINCLITLSNRIYDDFMNI